MITARNEDEADRWLREHDPYYSDSSRNKRDKYGVYYETPEQERRRREMEIPLSNLSMKQALNIGVAISGNEKNSNYEF